MCVCCAAGAARASAAPRTRQRKASDGSRLERRALKSRAEPQKRTPQQSVTYSLKVLVFSLRVTADESVQIPDCCFLKEAAFWGFFFFLLGKIGKQALICIINFVVIHIFEQPGERSRLNSEPTLVGTQGRRADHF